MSRMNKQPFSHTRGELRQTFWDAFLIKNIVLVQAISLCPIIAVGVSLQNGVVLTVCTAAVMLPVSLLMSLAGDRLPGWLRAPICTLLSSLILLGAMIVLDEFVSHELYAALYVFLPLTAVNTLVSYRAGGFSAKHAPLVALTDALASTLGFGLVICVVSALREMASFGTLWNIPLHFNVVLPEAALPYAALLLLGFMAAFLQWLKAEITEYQERRQRKEPVKP